MAVFLCTKPIYARSGCCSWHEGVCGCSCCDGTPLSATCAPYYPGCGGGYTQRPTCPVYSTYNSLTEKCECMSGYTASGNSCISMDQACQNKYGYNSKYNSLKDSCECRYGYVFNESGTRCESGNQSCWNKYGYNSNYDSLSNSCKCNYSYVFNNVGTKCISKDDWCDEELGFGSEYNSLKDVCECSKGYKLEGNRCTIDVPVYIPPQIPIVKSSSEPKIIPTPKPSPSSSPELSPSPSMENLPSIQLSPSPSINPEIKGVEVENKKLSFWERIFGWINNKQKPKKSFWRLLFFGK